MAAPHGERAVSTVRPDRNDTVVDDGVRTGKPYIYGSGVERVNGQTRDHVTDGIREFSKDSTLNFI